MFNLTHRTTPRYYNDPFFRTFGQLFDELQEYNNIPLNISKSDEGYECMFALPGHVRDDIEITTDDDYISVTVKERSLNEGQMVRDEFSYHGTRRIKLKGADITNSTARYESGILTISVPLSKKRPRETITIE